MIFYSLMILAVCLFIYTCILLKKNKLNKKYATMWMALSLLLIVFSVIPEILNLIMLKTGVGKQNIILTVGIVFLIIINFYTSLQISKLNKTILKLTEEVTLIKNK